MQEKLSQELSGFTEYVPKIRHKEIDLIQSIINRLANNQLKVKTLCLTILGFFIWKHDTNNMLSIIQSILVNSISIIACYTLDFSFLKTERLYRMWFEFLQDRRSETKAWLFELNPANIICILKDQAYIPDQFNPDLIKRNLYKNWSLKFYLFLALVGFIIYLPACLAAFSTQSTKLFLILW